MRNLIALCALTALGVSACNPESLAPTDPAFSFGASGNTYLITIENLTAHHPFTPPLIATHRASTGLFDVGSPASLAVREIAENGNLGPMLAAVEADKHVSAFSVLFGPEVPPVLPGQSVSMEIDATHGATRF
jgi:hypothetical protein